MKTGSSLRGEKFKRALQKFVVVLVGGSIINLTVTTTSAFVDWATYLAEKKFGLKGLAPKMTYQVKEQSFVTKPIKGVEWAEYGYRSNKKKTQCVDEGGSGERVYQSNEKTPAVLWFETLFFLFFLSVDFFRVQVFFWSLLIAVVLSQSRIVVGGGWCCLIARLDEWMNGMDDFRAHHVSRHMFVVGMTPVSVRYCSLQFTFWWNVLLFLRSMKVYRWLMVASMDGHDDEWPKWWLFSSFCFRSLLVVIVRGPQSTELIDRQFEEWSEELWHCNQPTNKQTRQPKQYVHDEEVHWCQSFACCWVIPTMFLFETSPIQWRPNLPVQIFPDWQTQKLELFCLSKIKTHE